MSGGTQKKSVCICVSYILTKKWGWGGGRGGAGGLWADLLSLRIVKSLPWPSGSLLRGGHLGAEDSHEFLQLIIFCVTVFVFGLV